MAKRRSALIRERARELFREGKARHWAEAMTQAAREVDRAAFDVDASEELREEVLEEASRKLFGNDPPKREPTAEEIEEASRRLFGERQGRNPTDLSESFADRSRGGRR